MREQKLSVSQEEPVIQLKPIISYPRIAETGEQYLLTIDVQLADGSPWPYKEEEFEISFVLETAPFFTHEPLGEDEPGIVLHRFGGTYGAAEYLLTASEQEVAPGNIKIALLNGWGLPIAQLRLECEVKKDVPKTATKQISMKTKKGAASTVTPSVGQKNTVPEDDMEQDIVARRLRPADNLIFGIEQMARELNVRRNLGGPRTVLFLGSRTSSLFRNPSLAEILEAFSPHDFSKMTKLEKFRECYKILDKWREREQYNDIHTYIDLALQGKSIRYALQNKKDEEALQERRAEVADLCVAELMKKGIFDAIITTNIGDNLENAFGQSSLIKTQDYNIVIPRPIEAAASPTPKGNAFEMIKISGDFASNQYSIWGYNIDSKEIYLESYKEINASIQRMSGEHMLVVGFDDVWDEHIIDTIFHRTGGTLWYVNEEQTREDSPIFPYLQQNKKVERFEGTLVSGYDLFFVNLCLHTLHTIPMSQEQQSQEKRRDFFISYTSPDRQWSEWIAWELENAGYSVYIQALDFLADGNFALDMQRAASQSKRTIMVLSEHYLKALFTQPEWAATFVQAPINEHGALLPVRVRQCEPSGFLKQLVYIDLVGLDEEEARRCLLENILRRSNKPGTAPQFPGQSSSEE